MSDDLPEKKRRGKAVKPKKGEAAKFEPGAAAAPKNFAAEKIARELHLWWENGDGQNFMIGHNAKTEPLASGMGDELFEERPQTWSRWPMEALKSLLRQSYFIRLKPREGHAVSEFEQVLLYVRKERRLDLSLEAISGYRAGIYDVQGKQVLVRSSPKLLDFKKGEWPTVKALIERKLNFYDEETDNLVMGQAQYFHSWMKKAVESLYLGGPGNFQSGPALVFAGPGDVGKSRIQHQVITPLLGGRSADPASYIFGKSDFNSEIFNAEHVMMEELEQASGKNVDRVLFGEKVKKLVTSDRQRLHAKREDAQMVEPFFRMTISINNDPDKLRLLFLLTPDMRDKVMLFLVSDAPLPMPTASLPERAAFRAQIASELPAYGHWLMNEYEIPAELQHGRFGVKCWHHPTLAMELFDDTPAAELLQIIDAAEFYAGESKLAASKLWDLKSDWKEMGEAWEGTAITLERLLLNDGGWTCSLEREAKKLCMHNKIERLLSRLKEDRPDRVSQHRTGMRRGWVITPAE